MGKRLKIMDYRLIIILTIYLNQGVFCLDCHAMKCTYNVTTGLDEDCEPLGDLTDTNRTSCAFYPCMKATGRESKDEELIDIRIYYCGHDADFNSVCENEDDCGKDTQAFTFKPSSPSGESAVTEIIEAEVCCCTSSGDMCNGSGLMKENSAINLGLNTVLSGCSSFHQNIEMLNGRM